MTTLAEIRSDLEVCRQHGAEGAAEQMADTLVDHLTWLLAEVQRPLGLARPGVRLRHVGVRPLPCSRTRDREEPEDVPLPGDPRRPDLLGRFVGPQTQGGRSMRPIHESALGGLRAVADGIAAFLTAPLRAYDEAHDYATPEDVAIEDRHQLGDTTWTIRVYDDQPVAEGKQYAAWRRVVLLRDGKQIREFLYPSYRIWTLLAHWTDGLADITDEEYQP